MAFRSQGSLLTASCLRDALALFSPGKVIVNPQTVLRINTIEIAPLPVLIVQLIFIEM